MADSSVFSPASLSQPTRESKSSATPNPTRVGATRTLAVFRLADAWFGIDLSAIERVAPIDYLNRLASGRGPILGTVGIRNRLVSVVDLRAILGIGLAAPEPCSTILVVRAGDYEIGILADEFVDVFFVPANQIARYPKDGDPALERTVTGEWSCGSRTITVVESSGIVDRLTAGVAG